MKNLKWKAKNDTCGVPGKGYIKAEDLSQEDIDNLKERCKHRKVDFHSFMLKAGFLPAEPQLEIDLDEEELTEELTEKPKRKRRTKAEIEAEGE